MKCNCDCHKKTAESDLKKCQDNNKRKTKEINVLKKKLMVATIGIAVGGTLVGKETIDKIVEYFQAYDRVKQSIDNSVSMTDQQLKHNTDDSIGYWGVSVLPSPGALTVFALPLFTPTPRRK
ncbi:MAG: hypothetical protein Unbinned97contig1000_21 [Prokaryotic dsDNA virus sp.]|nr:MAG: hypothetical protein Unbinned97contig1000_21 [Prokaryotic dsDNA virus sp.]|tara:strand:- start:3542 stop:3907 length:366 start_codon:yes stop_codon:yes gene_type:complete